MADCEHRGGTERADEPHDDGTVTCGEWCRDCDQLVRSWVE